jgi:hypothetical protein
MLRVHEGRPFTFSREEELELEFLSATLRDIVRDKEPGWRRELVLTHTAIGRRLHAALFRAQRAAEVTDGHGGPPPF